MFKGFIIFDNPEEVSVIYVTLMACGRKNKNALKNITCST
jgi:hypothetical protein